MCEKIFRENMLFIYLMKRENMIVPYIKLSVRSCVARVWQLLNNAELMDHGSFWNKSNCPMPKNLDNCACCKTRKIFES